MIIFVVVLLLALLINKQHNLNYSHEKLFVRKQKLTRRGKIIYMTQLSLLLAIEIIMCFTPMIGTIKIIPGSVEATLAFIPVIIGGVVLGPLAGGILGFCAGLCSFIYWTFIDPGNLSAIMFTPFHAFPIKSYWSLVICFVPRFLTGLGAGLIYQKCERFFPNQYVRIILACLIGSLTNTFLVLFGTYFLWGKAYGEAYGMNYSQLLLAIFTIIGTNGLLEAVFSTVVGLPVSKALLTIKS